MKPLVIPKTIATPKIEFNPNSKEFIIEGVSMPENPMSFYKEVISWIEKHIGSSVKEADLAIQLEYFNSSSALILVEIMQKFSELSSGNKVVWEYKKGDEDIKEAGEEYQIIIGDQLELKEV